MNGSVMVIGVLLLSFGCQPSEERGAGGASDRAMVNEVSEMETSERQVEMDAFAWEKRPVVLFAPDDGDERFQRQREIFQEAAAGLTEREIVIIEVLQRGVSRVDGQPMNVTSAESLRKRYDVAGDAFTVLLIGKDTGVKLREREPVGAEKLFALIDSMPMRRREMREE